jgi:hypothetical protein
MLAKLPDHLDCEPSLANSARTCDFIIAQGIEAGGHVRGTIGLQRVWLPRLGEVLGAVRVLPSSLVAAGAFPEEIVGEAINRDGTVASMLVNSQRVLVAMQRTCRMQAEQPDSWRSPRGSVLLEATERRPARRPKYLAHLFFSIAPQPL